jgi:hypothetical protein
MKVVHAQKRGKATLLCFLHLHSVWYARNKEERNIEERNSREMSHFSCLGDRRNRGERLISRGSHTFYLLCKTEKKDERSSHFLFISFSTLAFSSYE